MTILLDLVNLFVFILDSLAVSHLVTLTLTYWKSHVLPFNYPPNDVFTFFIRFVLVTNLK